MSNSFETPWTVAHQAPLSMGFPRQEYWSGWPLPSPGNLPDPEIELRSPALQADSILSEPPEKPTELVYRARVITLQFYSKSKEGNSFSRINDTTLDQANGNFLNEDPDFIFTSFRAK